MNKSKNLSFHFMRDLADYEGLSFYLNGTNNHLYLSIKNDMKINDKTLS